MNRFEAHGNAVLDVKGRVLCIRPQSPGNREEVQRLLDDIAAAVPVLEGRAWAALLSGETTHLLTPDAEQLLTRHAPQLVASGQRAMAIAVADDGPGFVIRGQWERVYAGTRCAVGVFRGEGEAREWVDQMLGEGPPL